MEKQVFNKELPVVIGSDHAGFEMKELLKARLTSLNWKVEDKGTHSLDSVDYPDYAHPTAEMVASGKAAFGILVCGSGNGVCMTANKHSSIRAALCWNEEIVSLARLHNNANILCLPARFVSQKEAEAMVDVFMNTAFEGGRHERRVEKIGQ